MKRPHSSRTRISRRQMRKIVFCVLLAVVLNTFIVAMWWLQQNESYFGGGSVVHVPHPSFHMEENRRRHKKLHKHHDNRVLLDATSRQEIDSLVQQAQIRNEKYLERQHSFDNPQNHIQWEPKPLPSCYAEMQRMSECVTTEKTCDVCMTNTTAFANLIPKIGKNFFRTALGLKRPTDPEFCETANKKVCEDMTRYACCCAAETKSYINCKFRKEWVSDFKVKDRSCGYHLNHGNSCEYDDPEDKDDDTIDPTPQSLLNCSAHNGPYDYESVEEMVYWKDIPADANYRSKFAPNNNLNDRYLTFETDLSGFNNQRMVFEINVITAIVTGRTLVMPRDRNLEHHVETKKVAMDDFFDLYGIAKEIPHIFKLMTIDEFIAREGTPDKLNFPSNFTDFYPRVRGRWRSYEDPITKEKSVDVNLTGVDNYHDKFLLEHYEQVFCSVPKLGKEVCSNYTDWIEQRHKVFYENLNFKFWRYDLDVYLAGHPDVAHPSWGSSVAILTIPNRTGDHAHDSSEQTKRFRSWTNWTRDSILKFKGNPAAVNAPPSERLQEIYQNRQGLAVYDAGINAMKYFHQVDTPKGEERLLGHFYDYIFFEDWKEDLWAKRFIRDKLRYTDQIQCAAAKIVAALREIANELHSKGSIYHAMHVRKGDLAKMYKDYGVDVNASGIFETVSIRRNIIPKSGIVYIATDEKDKTFFDSFVQNYKAVYFLDDFLGLLGPDFPSEYYGMVEQLVCSRAENFVGTFYSTFTAYINRLRGYHSQKHRPNVAASQDNTSRGRADKEADLQKKRLAREQGVISSWYFAPQEKIDVYQNYEAIGANNIFAMEFPIAWRNIDFDVDEELRATLDRDVVVAETVARNEVRMAMGMNNFSQVNKHDDDNFGKDGNNCNDQNEHNVTAGKHVRCSIN